MYYKIVIVWCVCVTLYIIFSIYNYDQMKEPTELEEVASFLTESWQQNLQLAVLL